MRIWMKNERGKESRPIKMQPVFSFLRRYVLILPFKIATMGTTEDRIFLFSSKDKIYRAQYKILEDTSIIFG